MAEYGTEAFKELWRQRGFFAALDSSPRHGQSSVEEMRRLNCSLMREKIAEMRKELARMQSVLERLDHDTMAGSAGGKVEQLHLERNVVEMGGWIASVLESYAMMDFYLSEAGFRKAQGFISRQTSESGAHPSRELLPR
ncbi:MAG: hypothetical protein JNL62_06600 [Bryobacterales bacterium]|nr:hypothetical protein [Bryobacterales bacterium]